MRSYRYTIHAQERLQQYRIRREWVERTLRYPDNKEYRKSGKIHYLKAISEHGGQILRVIVDPRPDPAKIVTVHFDS